MTLLSQALVNVDSLDFDSVDKEVVSIEAAVAELQQIDYKLHKLTVAAENLNDLVYGDPVAIPTASGLALYLESEIRTVYRQLGIVYDGSISLEDMKGMSISIESLGKTAEAVWKALKRAMRELYEKISYLIFRLLNNLDDVSAEFYELMEEIKKLPSGIKPSMQQVVIGSNNVNNLTNQGKLVEEAMMFPNYVEFVYENSQYISDVLKTLGKAEKELESNKDIDDDTWTQLMSDIRSSFITDVVPNYKNVTWTDDTTAGYGVLWEIPNNKEVVATALSKVQLRDNFKDIDEVKGLIDELTSLEIARVVPNTYKSKRHEAMDVMSVERLTTLWCFASDYPKIAIEASDRIGKLRADRRKDLMRINFERIRKIASDKAESYRLLTMCYKFSYRHLVSLDTEFLRSNHRYLKSMNVYLKACIDSYKESNN